MITRSQSENYPTLYRPRGLALQLLGLSKALTFLSQNRIEGSISIINESFQQNQDGKSNPNAFQTDVSFNVKANEISTLVSGMHADNVQKNSSSEDLILEEFQQALRKVMIHKIKEYWNKQPLICSVRHLQEMNELRGVFLAIDPQTKAHFLMAIDLIFYLRQRFYKDFKTDEQIISLQQIKKSEKRESSIETPLETSFSSNEEEKEKVGQATLQQKFKVVYVASSQKLIDQFCSLLQSYPELTCTKFSGSKGPDADANFFKDKFEELFDRTEVLLLVNKKYQTLVQQGFLFMEDISLLIIDEGQNATNDHPSNTIMKDYFFNHYKMKLELMQNSAEIVQTLNVPRVLAFGHLSDLKQSQDLSHKMFEFKIDSVNEVSRNLFCKTIFINKEDYQVLLDQIKRELASEPKEIHIPSFIGQALFPEFKDTLINNERQQRVLIKEKERKLLEQIVLKAKEQTFFSFEISDSLIEDIILSLPHQHEYIVTSKNARIHVRESASPLIDLFMKMKDLYDCGMLDADKVSKLTNAKPKNFKLEEEVKKNQKNKFAPEFKSWQDLKKDQYFRSITVFPIFFHGCMVYFNEQKGYQKKKDAQNKSAFLAIQLLKMLGLFNDYLLPDLYPVMTDEAIKDYINQISKHKEQASMGVLTKGKSGFTYYFDINDHLEQKEPTKQQQNEKDIQIQDFINKPDRIQGSSVSNSLQFDGASDIASRKTAVTLNSNKSNQISIPQSQVMAGKIKRDENQKDREEYNKIQKDFHNSSKQQGNKRTLEVKKDHINVDFEASKGLIQTSKLQDRINNVPETSLIKQMTFSNSNYLNLASETCNVEMQKIAGPNVSCLVVVPKNVWSSYPFENTRKIFGILQDEDFSLMKFDYILKQENKQMAKNSIYQVLLAQNGLITEKERFMSTQLNDQLEYTKVSVNFPREITVPYKSEEEFIDKLNMFHQFIFFLNYNGQFDLYLRILTNNVPFSRLFEKILNIIANDKRRIYHDPNDIFQKQKTDSNFKYNSQIKKYPLSLTEYLFGKNIFEKQKSNEFSSNQRSTESPHQRKRLDRRTVDSSFTQRKIDVHLESFVVPLIVTKSREVQIDFQLIDDTYHYICHELLNLFLLDGKKHQILARHNIITVENNNRQIKLMEGNEGQNLAHQFKDDQAKFSQEMKYIQVCNFNQSTFQLIAKYPNFKKDWNAKIIKLIPGHIKKDQYNMTDKQIESKYAIRLSVPEHYFVKNGVYIDKKENQFLYKCNRQRHFLDLIQLKTGSEFEEQIFNTSQEEQNFEEQYYKLLKKDKKDNMMGQTFKQSQLQYLMQKKFKGNLKFKDILERLSAVLYAENSMQFYNQVEQVLRLHQELYIEPAFSEMQVQTKMNINAAPFVPKKGSQKAHISDMMSNFQDNVSDTSSFVANSTASTQISDQSFQNEGITFKGEKNSYNKDELQLIGTDNMGYLDVIWKGLNRIHIDQINWNETKLELQQLSDGESLELNDQLKHELLQDCFRKFLKKCFLDKQFLHQIVKDEDKLNKVNTKFDLPEQLLTKSPFSFENYVQMQTVCFQVSQMNEMKLVRRFIKDFLRGIQIKERRVQIEQYYEKKSPILDLYQTRLPLDLSIKNADEYFQRNSHYIMHALTSPTASRMFDYERLEFYGDSVISFLVILELFLCGNPDWNEGDLDHERIKRVSNMNFTYVNEETHLYEYMIADQSRIFNDYIPAAFSSDDYQMNVKQKHINEIQTRLYFLRKSMFLAQLDLEIPRDDILDEETVSDEYIELIKTYLLQTELKDQLFKNECPEAQKILLEEQKRQGRKINDDSPLSMNNLLLFRVGERWIQDLGLTISRLKLIGIKYNMIKTERKLDQEKRKRPKLMYQPAMSQKNNYRSHLDGEYYPNPALSVSDKKQPSMSHDKEHVQKQFQIKQMADVVESVVGVVTFRCGLETAHQFIKEKYALNCVRGKKTEEVKSSKNQRRPILEKSIEDYDKQLEYLKNNTKTKQDLYLNRGKIENVEKIIGYKFHKEEILLQALTHKSTKESTVDDRDIDAYRDYERLEFLGDSILNFLVAQHFFLKTEEDGTQEDHKPKQLHTLKTSTVNNVLLSLIVIENGIHENIIYNEGSLQFKQQFDRYVNYVKQQVSQTPTNYLAEVKRINSLKIDLQSKEQKLCKLFDQMRNLNPALVLTNQDLYQIHQDVINRIHRQKTLIDSSRENKRVGEYEQQNLNDYQFEAFNDYLEKDKVNFCQIFASQSISMDKLHEHSLKIFGDIFESILGAVLIDSKSLQTTSDVLFNLLNPYIQVYANLQDVQNHKRTVLLEYWNSKDYAKKVRITHKTSNMIQNGEEYVVFTGMVEDLELYNRQFNKDDKNKIRSFYTEFYDFIKQFIESFEANVHEYPLTEVNFVKFQNLIQRAMMDYLTFYLKNMRKYKIDQNSIVK